MATVFIVILIVAYAVLVLGIAVRIIFDLRRAPLGRRDGEVLGCKLGPDSCQELVATKGQARPRIPRSAQVSLPAYDYIDAETYTYADKPRWDEAVRQASAFVDQLRLVYRRPYWFSLDYLIQRFEADCIMVFGHPGPQRELHKAALISLAAHRSIGAGGLGGSLYLMFDGLDKGDPDSARVSGGVKPPPLPPTRARPEGVETI